ncbi:pyridoxal-dependent decarboxylase, exosortase A system-associated [Pseudoalteromonas denitrificans]|uniref:Diaminopimelate decarboxylase n=1 Tax=Pseudoalteromonas denitrificans DSM 6059 TaxID=1123010 RepID=A0A1I1PP50_9GAMM|nr:pyridoxal-dependent decarboxylase, exosortase A system-associated [Pseudoalteromonas denitrificans]SFD09428.1 diaminopimelate decarboxylase [Pseudoalteromonas denitrificans DSM 6059]
MFTSKNNQLVIAGKTANEVIAIAGGTPCYVYDRKKILDKIHQLKIKLPEGVKLHYAIKANPFTPLVSQMATWVDGFDVASHKELLLALATGMPSEHISFAGPGKSDDDLNAAVVSEVVINVESVTELNRIYALCKKYQCKANISFRINPDFELKNSGMQMSGGAKPFGIDAECIPNVLRTLKTELVNFKGLHIFTGSQNLNHNALIEVHNKTFALAYALLNMANMTAFQINIGGGFGIPYFINDQALELTPVLENLSSLMTQYGPLLNNAQIHLELGRYLVGEGGTYLSRIIDKKISRGKTFLVTNGGMHHHLANSGNFGQVIRKNYPVLLASNIQSDDVEVVDVVGPLCTPLDILASNITLPFAQPDDIFAVLQSGAYGASASPHDFLSQPKVKEVLL